MNAMTVLARLTTVLADRYSVGRDLGAGGMATVYLAHDIRAQLSSWRPGHSSDCASTP